MTPDGVAVLGAVRAEMSFSMCIPSLYGPSLPVRTQWAGSFLEERIEFFFKLTFARVKCKQSGTQASWKTYRTSDYRC